MKMHVPVREEPVGEPGPQYVLLLTLIIVIPVLVFFFSHVWMRSAYSDVFHLQKFLENYGVSIFRYRIFGSKLLLFIYHSLASHYPDRIFAMPNDPEGSFLFYVAYSVIDGVFFFLTNLALLLFLWDRKRGISSLKLAQYCFLVLVLTLSTYVVTPYDQIAYFFMLFAFLSVKFKNSYATYLIVAVAAIAGTLNRETEFLVTPALLTVALFAGADRSKRYYSMGLFHLLLFTVCYVGLRVFIPGASEVTAGFTYGGKWAALSFAVVSAVYYIGSSLVLREYSDFRPSLVVLLLSAPYIIVVLLSGQIRELRLLVPLLLSLFFVYAQLAKLKIERLTVPGPVSIR